MTHSNLDDFTKWLTEVNAMPDDKILWNQLEKLTDDQILDLFVTCQLEPNVACTHMPLSRSKILVNRLYELKPELFNLVH